MHPCRRLPILNLFFCWIALSFASVWAEQPRPKTVQLTVDYGDGVQKRFTSILWKEKMTILDALDAAAGHPRGIRFEYRASGSIALLTSIDDLKNQGGRGSNWIYWVNEELGDRSFAIQELSAGDHVLWKYGTYE